MTDVGGSTGERKRERPVLRQGPMRWILFVAGWLCAALGALGAFLPVLPTTPFLLLATACFLRSSPRLHARLLANERFGPYLRQWEQDRSVPRSAKHRAYALVALTFAVSILVAGNPWVRGVLVACLVGLLAFLRSLPETEHEVAMFEEPDPE